MRIALFGKSFTNEIHLYLQQLITKLESINSSIFIYEPFYKIIKEKINFNSNYLIFNTHKEIIHKVDFLFSIGGDGTLLDTITLVRNSEIPVLGINLGKLGFLSSIPKDKIIPAIDEISKGKYKLDKRTLLKLETSNNLFGELNYALNDCIIHKKDPFSLLTISATVNDEFVNSYWADGLIIATPTGSTAYSLSAGGPIIMPGSENFVISPIATHNLTVRPIVIPDNSIIKINIIGEKKDFFVSLDSRSETVNSSIELIIKKEEFRINLLQMEDENFFKTIRDKLMWGSDRRN